MPFQLWLNARHQEFYIVGSRISLHSYQESHALPWDAVKLLKKQILFFHVLFLYFARPNLGIISSQGSFIWLLSLCVSGDSFGYLVVYQAFAVLLVGKSTIPCLCQALEIAVSFLSGQTFPYRALEVTDQKSWVRLSAGLRFFLYNSCSLDTTREQLPYAGLFHTQTCLPNSSR